ncbi:MAG: MFS transporter [Rhodospirillales bacterium]
MAALGMALSRDVKVIGLVCAAHMMSHVYFFVLPPVFPLLRADLDVSYTLLGLCMTAFGLAAGLGQTPVGFLVDRIGARPVLVAGFVLQAGAVALIGLIDSYWQLLVLYTLAGIGHTVFHPADYAILAASVPKQRLGRAFASHSVVGTIGFALTPALMIAIAELWHWRAAFMIVGAAGLAVAAVLWAQGSLLGDHRTTTGGEPREARPPATVGDTARLLLSLPILMCFLYFVVQISAVGGIRSFFVAAMDALYQTPLVTVNAALTGLLVGTSAGMAVGGFVADRYGPSMRVAALTLIPAGALILLVGLVALPDAMLFAAMTLSGFLQGILTPSRDLLLRSVTPDGSMGRVIGFTSSGANLGAGLIPLLFGWMLDHGEPALVFWVTAALVAVAFVTFVAVKGRFAPAAGGRG